LGRMTERPWRRTQQAARSQQLTRALLQGRLG